MAYIYIYIQIWKNISIVVWLASLCWPLCLAVSSPFNIYDLFQIRHQARRWGPATSVSSEWEVDQMNDRERTLRFVYSWNALDIESLRRQMGGWIDPVEPIYNSKLLTEWLTCRKWECKARACRMKRTRKRKDGHRAVNQALFAESDDETNCVDRTWRNFAKRWRHLIWSAWKRPPPQCISATGLAVSRSGILEQFEMRWRS